MLAGERVVSLPSGTGRKLNMKSLENTEAVCILQYIIIGFYSPSQVQFTVHIGQADLQIIQYILYADMYILHTGNIL